jgi:hypothetical protein
VDIFEDEDPIPNLTSYPVGTPGAIAASVNEPASMTDRATALGAMAEPTATDDGEETVFSVLAGRARTRASAHLWLTAGIGGVDAVALMATRPTLWWVAAGCATVSMYAIWGLADRALSHLDENARRRWKPRVLRGVRVLAVAAGVAGAVATALGFIGIALGKGTPQG